jgi:hypothetical protein
MQIDESEEQSANADSPRCESFEPDSNVTAERERHLKKHFSPSRSTEEGMQIDERDEHSENARLPMLQSSEPDSNVRVDKNRH